MIVIVVNTLTTNKFIHFP